MFGIEPSYLLWIAALIVLVILYFTFLRRRKTEAPAEDVSKKMRQGVGDALIGENAEKTTLTDAISADEPEAPKLDEPVKEEGEATASAVEAPIVAPEPAPEVPHIQEPAAEELPKVALEQPELAPEIKPLVTHKGRTLPNVDAMLDVWVKFTPKEKIFTADRLVQVQAFIDAEELTDVVIADYFNGEAGVWDANVRGNDSCSAVVIKMQLANRSHVADDLLVSRFLQLANRISIEIEADAEMPDVVVVLNQAKTLKTLISHYDNTLSLYVETEAPFEGNLLKDTLVKDGFTHRGSAFVKCAAEEKDPYFTVHVTPENPTIIALELDIPLCDPALKPLQDLFETANDLACDLGGVLVDQAKNPIGAAAATYIDAELKKLALEMDSQGLALGAERTVKLFSR